MSIAATRTTMFEDACDTVIQEVTVENFAGTVVEVHGAWRFQPDSEPGNLQRLTRARVGEKPESGEIDLEPYAGQSIQVIGRWEHDWVYEAEIVDPSTSNDRRLVRMNPGVAGVGDMLNTASVADAPAIEAAATRAQALLGGLIKDLSERAGSSGATDTRATSGTPARTTPLFFPNGIELISVAVKAGVNAATPNVDVEITVAGKAGMKPAAAGFGREAISVSAANDADVQEPHGTHRAGGTRPRRQTPGASYTLSALEPRGRNAANLQDHLRALGYFPEVSDRASEGTADEVTTEALRRYQRFFGLTETGQLDNATVAQMRRPRCGNPDVVARRLLVGNPWAKNLLTFGFRSLPTAGQINSVAVASAAFLEGFSIWSTACPMQFRAAGAGEDPDIHISFGHPYCQGIHADACTSGPPDGTMVFETDDDWVRTPAASGDCYDVVAFACHEVGHALGLDHSPDVNSIMYPTIDCHKRGLSPGDVDAITAIYGTPLVGSV